MMTKNTSTTGIEQMGNSVLRYSLVTNLVWIGSLKFQDYEMAVSYTHLTLPTKA